jgi:hypothetical protein
MKIEYSMSYSELNRLGGDSALIPILRSRGMLIGYSPPPIKLVAFYGNFYWNDWSGQRTFTWEALDNQTHLSQYWPSNWVDLALPSISNSLITAPHVPGIIQEQKVQIKRSTEEGLPRTISLEDV